MTRSLAAGLFVLFLLGFAPAPLPRRAPDDLKRLQGEWRLVRAAMGDAWHGDVEGAVVVKGDQVTFHSHGVALNTWEVRLNPSKPLKELDLEGDSRFSVRAGGNVIRYVYRLEANELTLWESSTDNSVRPTLTDPRETTYAWVYRRQKR
jgi:uncharacterized protein (TIGR03067 family)